MQSNIRTQGIQKAVQYSGDNKSEIVEFCEEIHKIFTVPSVYFDNAEGDSRVNITIKQNHKDSRAKEELVLKVGEYLIFNRTYVCIASKESFNKMFEYID